MRKNAKISISINLYYIRINIDVYIYIFIILDCILLLIIFPFWLKSVAIASKCLKMSGVLEDLPIADIFPILRTSRM